MINFLYHIYGVTKVSKTRYILFWSVVMFGNVYFLLLLDLASIVPFSLSKSVEKLHICWSLIP